MAFHDIAKYYVDGIAIYYEIHFSVQCTECAETFSCSDDYTKSEFTETIRENGWKKVKGRWLCKKCIDKHKSE